MPSSAVRTFTDPDNYSAEICAAKAELTITGRGRFTAKLIRIDLHRLWLQRAFDNLPRISQPTIIAGRATISFRTAPGPSLLTAGLEMRPSDIVRHSDGESYCRRSSGLAAYASMSLPVEVMVSVGAAIAGLDLSPPKNPLAHTPQPSAMAKLQRLHATAGRLAEDAPEIIAIPGAARGLEQALIEALVECLSTGEFGEEGLARRRIPIALRRKPICHTSATRIAAATGGSS